MKEVVDSGNVKVLYADHEYFINKLKNKEQFNYTRVQHGILDLLIETYNREVPTLLDAIQNERWIDIATNVIKHNNRIIQVWHKSSESLLNEFASSYRIIYENSSLVPNLHLGVSAGVGFGMNAHGNLPESNAMQQYRAKVLETLTQKSPKLYHGGLSRHMGVMGDTFDFFNKLNDIGVDVLIYGPQYMKEYKNVFNIKKFHHLPIPDYGAIHQINKAFPTMIEYCSKLENPLIINCCGHTISLLLAYNLKDTNISNFDIGRGFDWSLKDYVLKNTDIKNPWLTQPEHLLREYVNKIRNFT